MTEPAEKIIVFDSYDNVIMANIVKTKLDAYGIPCFLTGENFTNMYPIRNEIFPGARLHIFEKDLERVKEILMEESVTAVDVICCPHCRSSNVTPLAEKGYLGPMFAAFFLSMVGVDTPPEKKVYYCRDCRREFEITL